jgi:alpha-ketoglutarate-dependent taurine dioxygenase
MIEQDAPAGVRASWLAEDRRPPLILEPDGPSGAGDLVAWLTTNRAWVQAALPRIGALCLRGFAVREPDDFERVARAIDPDLKNDYLGTSPRDARTAYVFSASELPAAYPIPPHCEMSFVKEPPRHLFFWCDVAVQGPGGETPLTDVRRVWRDLPADVRARFAAKGIRNVRNYGGPEGSGRFDLWKLKPWHEMFRTTDRAEVERKAAENGFEATWHGEGRLRLVNRQPASAHHPVTGEELWFNHLQVFHLAAVPCEYGHVRERLGAWPWGALGALSRAIVAIKRRTTDTEAQAMHCTYADGSPIPDADVAAVSDAFWKNMAFPRWEEGMVVAIDNHSVAHGRMPYRGPRRVNVAWA